MEHLDNRVVSTVAPAKARLDGAQCPSAGLDLATLMYLRSRFAVRLVQQQAKKEGTRARVPSLKNQAYPSLPDRNDIAGESRLALWIAAVLELVAQPGTGQLLNASVAQERVARTLVGAGIPARALRSRRDLIGSKRNDPSDARGPDPRPCWIMVGQVSVT